MFLHNRTYQAWGSCQTALLPWHSTYGHPILRLFTRSCHGSQVKQFPPVLSKDCTLYVRSSAGPESLPVFGGLGKNLSCLRGGRTASE